MLFGFESFTWLDTSFFVGNYVLGYMLPSVFTIIFYKLRWRLAIFAALERGAPASKCCRGHAMPVCLSPKFLHCQKDEF
jgi:hypothetical protein